MKSIGLLLLDQQEQGQAIGLKHSPYLALSPYRNSINTVFVYKDWQ